MLKMITFDIQDCGYDCNCDYLKVAIGESSTQRSKTYCQKQLNDPDKKIDLSKAIYSVYSNIWLTFQSNNESFNNYKGFYATFEQINYTPPG